MARYTQEEYKQARDVNILDFLKSQGYELEKNGISDYQLKSHDSLKISKDGKKWVWHSRGTGGESPIELLKQLEEVGTIEAIKRLSSYSLGNVSAEGSAQPARKAKAEKKPPFMLPEKWSDNKRAFAYLTETRKLDPDIVNYCFDKGLIYESKKFHNVVFLGQKNDAGEIKYASLRGTYTTAEKPFKGDVTSSDKSYSFAMEGTSDSLIVYESAIDALSHASLEKMDGADWKNAHRVTLGSLSDKSIERYLEKHPGIKKITFSLDNDKDGKDKDGNPHNHGQVRAAALSDKFKSLNYMVSNLVPTSKDVNEDLKSKTGSIAPSIINHEKKEDEKDSADIMQRLEAGVKSVFTSPEYLSYLKVLAKFHRYSVNNCILIKMQMSSATRVAGFRAWKKDFERDVKKGAKGISVLAPAEYKYTENKKTIDSVTHKEIEEPVEKKRIYFKPVTVFDISQTEGKELPTLTNELNFSVDQSKNFISAIKNISEKNNVSFNFEKIDDGSKGYFSFAKNKIGIKEGMSDAQTIKTAIHELAHSIMHVPTDETSLANSGSTNSKEVQAESVAFVVSDYFGIDTSDYSFPYIASWSSGKETEELKSSLNIVKKEASNIIQDIEKQLELIREKQVAVNEKTVAIKSYETTMKLFKQGVPLFIKDGSAFSLLKDELDIQSNVGNIFLKTTDLEKHKEKIPEIYESYICGLFKEAYKVNAVAALQIFGYENLANDSLSQAIISNDKFIIKLMTKADSLKACIEIIQNQIENVKAIKSNAIVQIDYSDNKKLREGQYLKFKDANKIFKQLGEEKIKNGVDYDKEKIAFGLFIKEKSQWKYGKSRYDIGESFEDDLLSFTKKTMDKDITEICQEEVSEKTESKEKKTKEEKIK